MGPDIGDALDNLSDVADALATWLAVLQMEIFRRSRAR